MIISSQSRPALSKASRAVSNMHVIQENLVIQLKIGLFLSEPLGNSHKEFPSDAFLKTKSSKDCLHTRVCWL